MERRNMLLAILICILCIAPVAAAEVDLHSDDFESGGDIWYLEEGWSLIEEEDGNHVLKGTKHTWARSEADGVVSKFMARAKIEKGDLQMGLRLTASPGGQARYYVGFNVDEGFSNIQKQTGSEETIQTLKQVERCFSPNEWHDVEIWIDGNKIYVHVDDALMIWARDEGELITTGSGIHFETLDDSIAYVDDTYVEVLEPSEIPVETPVYSKPPNVITKRISSGVIGQSDGEIVFEVSNEDPNHYLEGYLSCDVPSDMMVTSAIGAATGEEAQYISQRFTIEPAPGRESMTLRLSSIKPGNKYMRCMVNYVLYSEEKGYINMQGQYSQNLKYREITVNRDISFLPGEEVAEPSGKDGQTDRMIVIGLAALAAIVILFLVYKVGMLTGRGRSK